MKPLVALHFRSTLSWSSWSNFEVEFLLSVVLEEGRRHGGWASRRKIRGENWLRKRGPRRLAGRAKSCINNMDTDISRTDAPTRIVRYSKSMKRRRFAWLLRYVRCQFGEWRSPHQGFVPIWIAGTWVNLFGFVYSFKKEKLIMQLCKDRNFFFFFGCDFPSFILFLLFVLH